jgi:hypothetical protein
MVCCIASLIAPVAVSPFDHLIRPSRAIARLAVSSEIGAWLSPGRKIRPSRCAAARPLGHCLAIQIGGYVAHVVVNGRQHPEGLARHVDTVAALAAFGDQTARAVDSARVKLGELHVFEWKSGAQRHGISGAGMGRRAGEIDSAVAARCQPPCDAPEDDVACLLHVPGEQVVIHQEIERKILDEELGVVL